MRIEHKKRDLKYESKVKVTCNECGKAFCALRLQQHKEFTHRAQPKKTLGSKPASKTFALTGDTDQSRPLILLLLKKEGYILVEYPAKGTFALICGK